MWKMLKNGVRTVLAVAIALLCLLGGLLQNACVLRGVSGEHVFYCYSASSQAKIQTKLRLQDVFFLTGESVRLEESTQTDALEIIKELGAEIVFCERVGETVSIYAFSPNLPQGILLYGKMVNLHIAISTQGCMVGTPIIFGGY